MNTIWTIFKKEIKSYFASPVAYIVMTTFLVFCGWFFFRRFFVIGQASMRPLFSILPWLFLVLIPAISMRIWSEEKKSGTLDFVLTFPIHDWEIVMGKFLASFCLFALCVLGTLPLAYITFYFGPPDSGTIVTGYIGALLLGASFLAMGMFFSSLTENQIIAFILSVLACFFSMLLSQNLVLYSLPEFLRPLLRELSLGGHFDSISKGVLSFKDLFFYGCYLFFFIYLNVHVLDSRRVE